jgi:predicted RNA-binding Zn-ribbon protein involved in translation (DUF1610 family)
MSLLRHVTSYQDEEEEQMIDQKPVDWTCKEIRHYLNLLSEIGECDYCGKQLAPDKISAKKPYDGGCLIMLCDKHRHFGEPYEDNTTRCFT